MPDDEALSAAPGWKDRLRVLSRNRKLWNFVLLVGGFAFGQGVLLLVQTLLVADRKLALLSLFGVHFSTLILLNLIIDFGFVVVLAKDAATLLHQEGEHDEIAVVYWRACAFRLIVAAAIGVACVAYAIYGHNGFSRAFVATAVPGLLIWAFNATGVLDGMRVAGLGGISSTFPYFCAALGLLVGRQLPHEYAGALIGTMLSVGYVATVLTHFFVMRRLNVLHRPHRESLAGLGDYARKGFSALIVTIPGQFYFRIQLYISTVFLGHALTGMLIYAKQVSTAFNQVAGAIRRIEFPDLVVLMRQPGPVRIRAVLGVQKYGFAVALVGVVGLGAASLLVWLTQDDPVYRQTAEAVAIFAPTIFLLVLSQSLLQAVQAKGNYTLAAIASIIGTGLATIFTYVAARPFGLVAFAAGEVLICGVMVVLSVRYLRGAGDPPAPSPAIPPPPPESSP